MHMSFTLIHKLYSDPRYKSSVRTFNMSILIMIRESGIIRISLNSIVSLIFVVETNISFLYLSQVLNIIIVTKKSETKSVRVS